MILEPECHHVTPAMRRREIIFEQRDQKYISYKTILPHADISHGLRVTIRWIPHDRAWSKAGGDTKRWFSVGFYTVFVLFCLGAERAHRPARTLTASVVNSTVSGSNGSRFKNTVMRTDIWRQMVPRGTTQRNNISASKTLKHCQDLAKRTNGN